MGLTIGKHLTKAREDRKLSVEMVAFQTKIRVEYIKALEADQFSSLPSRVQGRGFLRNYANFLNLPADVLLSAWDGGELPEILTSHGAENHVPATAPEVIIDDTVKELVVSSKTGPDLPQVAHLPEEGIFFSDDEADASEEDLRKLNITEPIVSTPTSESQQIFDEIGSELRNQREKLNLSISEVEQYTKVRGHYLEALENGMINDLPSLVQGRGMLSNYAHFLNLDTERLLLRFADALQSRRNELARPVSPGSKTRKIRAVEDTSPTSLRRLLTPDLIISSLLIITLSGFILWGASKVVNLNNPEIEPTPPSISEVLLNTPTFSIGSTATPEGSQSTPISELPPSLAGTEATPTSEFLATAPLQINMIALQRSYVRITVDKKVVFAGRVIPGNAYEYSGTDSIELLTGNAAGIQVFFNQNDLGVLGTTGQVVDLIFTPPDVMVTPTPLVNPTATLPPTSTSTPKPTPTVATPTVTPFIP